MTLLGTELFCILAGAVLLGVAWTIASDATHPRRLGSMVFWGGLGIVFAGGPHIPDAIVGAVVMLLAVIAIAGQVAPPAATVRTVREAGWRVLVPAGVIPLCVVAGTLVYEHIGWHGWRLVAKGQGSVVAIGVACVVGLVVALRQLGARPAEAVEGGSRLLQVLGWSLILPQLLAVLGGVLAQAGAGDWIAVRAAAVVPVDSPTAAVVAYCGAMALFTMVLGNAFAAFPVVTLGIGMPFIVQRHGGDPAIMGALGMLSGYCGTLLTPMAANFNLVPALLLELRDQRGVMRAQAPMAVAIWAFNVVAMRLLVFTV